MEYIIEQGAVLITYITDVTYFWFLTGGIFGYFAFFRRWRPGLLFVATILSTSLSVYLLKNHFSIDRPAEALFDFSGYAFPSGHAANAAALAIVSAYLFLPVLAKYVSRKILILVHVALATAIGFSRIVVGAHYVDDVVAGFALGIFWATVCIVIYHHYFHPK